MFHFEVVMFVDQSSDKPLAMGFHNNRAGEFKMAGWNNYRINPREKEVMSLAMFQAKESAERVFPEGIVKDVWKTTFYGGRIGDRPIWTLTSDSPECEM